MIGGGGGGGGGGAYYCRFIPDYSSIASLLTDLTRKSAPNTVVCGEKCH